MDFAGVRALVVSPELPVAGGMAGAPASVVPEELDDCHVVDSLVRALVVLPEFAPAVGSFFGVVEASPELACVEFAESVESAAGFFFFFFAVESVCDWSVDCVDRRELLPCDVLVKPNPNNKTIKTAKLTFFFIAILWLLLEDSLHHS